MDSKDIRGNMPLGAHVAKTTVVYSKKSHWGLESIYEILNYSATIGR